MATVDDLLEALGAPDSAARVRALDEAGKLTQLLPELEEGRGFKQPELHYFEVLDHNLAALAAADAVLGDGEEGRELRQAVEWLDFDGSLAREIDGVPLVSLLKLSCLVHDVAKPATATVLEGRLRFPRHGPTGAAILRERLPALGFGEGATDFVARLVRYHLRPGELIKAWPPTDHAMRRFVTDLDGHVLPLMVLQMCDGWATRGPRYTRENFRRHCDFLSYVVARSLAVMEEPERGLITGEDLMLELGLTSGRTLGAVLTSIRRAQDEGAVSTREEALALAQVTLASMSGNEGQPGP